MKNKSGLFKVLKIGFVLALVYLIIGVSHFFVFSDKLTYDELVVITEYYDEIRPVENSIKSDFYVDTLLKVLDKQYILEELRKDSLTYGISVVDKSFEIFKDTLVARTAEQYVYRCYLDFDNFVGLENTQDLFDLAVSFYSSSGQAVEDLETFATFMDEIVSKEYTYLNKVSESRHTTMTRVGISYFVLIFFFYFIDINKVLNSVTTKVNKIKKEAKK